MKKLILLIVSVLCLCQIASAQRTSSITSAGNIAGAPAGVKPFIRKPSTMGFIHPIKTMVNNTNLYTATTFTFGDIAIFSYFDSTVVNIVDASGNVVGNATMRADTIYSISPGQGIYTISGNKPYSVLIGDPITNYVNGYFALDQSGRGLSTKLNTWMMYSGSSYYDPHFIIFAYQDNTQFTLKDLQTGSILYAGTLNTGQYFDYPNVASISDKALQVVSNLPVSALSYTDQDYYVPSSNGGFSGTLFYGFSGYSGSWENSITIVSYADNNNVLVTDINTGDTLGSFTLGLWQVKTIPVFKDTYWKIVSSGTVTAADIPFAGWSGSYDYMARTSDSTGTNTGKAYIVPTIQSQISIFSYDDNNRVIVTLLGDTSYPYTSPTQIADTLLQSGQGYIFSSNSGNYVYRVEGTGRVSVLQSSGGFGADFMPLGYTLDLPDLAISQNDIVFTPADSVYKQGEQIQIGVTVHNQGTVDASNVYVELYDGNPDVGVAPPVGSFQIPLIPAGGSYTGSVPYVVPSNSQYHFIYVKVDPNNTIAESNESNNEAFKPLKANQDLLPPLSVYITAPSALGIQKSNLSPNPFVVHADIFNTGTVDAGNVRIQFFTYNGLAIDSGSVDTTITSIPAQGSLSMNWEIMANKDSTGLNLYTIQIGGTNIPLKYINRGVLIPDLVPPAAPVQLKAISQNIGQVLLTWAPNTEKDLGGYKIYYSSAPTGFTGNDANEGPSPIIVSTIDTMLITGLTGGKTYRFALTAFDLSTNESSFSNVVSVIVDSSSAVSRWTINILAATSLLKDSSSYAGVDANATDGFDSAYDVPKPPQPPNNFVYVYFPHPEWNSVLGPNFMSDMRLDTDMTYIGKVWNFGVATDQYNQTMSLSLFLSTSIPWGYSLRLIDMKTDSTIDLRMFNSYTYNTGSDSLRMFQIIVGGPISLSYTYNAGWSMVGLPLKMTYPSKSSVFGQAASTYLYGYSASDGYSVADFLSFGQGYWLGALSPVTASITGVQVMDSVGVALNPGFNIISLPYNISNYSKHSMFVSNGSDIVSLDSAVSLNWVSPALYAYQSTSGNYSAADTLTPWNGYWFGAIDSTLRLIFEPPMNNLPSMTTMQQFARTLNKNTNTAVSDSNWYVKLSLQAGKSVDQLGGFGIASKAKSGFNAAYDLPHPPNPPATEYVYLSFPHPEWGSVIGPNFSADVKPYAKSTIWKFIAGTNAKSTTATLTWDSSMVPNGVTIMLADLSHNGNLINMKRTGEYKFTINGIDSMQITSSIVTGISEPSPVVPSKFVLSQNYPNPFNPSTVISFDIPKQSIVKLVVYDILGRVVKTLVDEMKSPGNYKVRFDASMLTSGVYFYRITAGNFTDSKKLLLVK